MNKDLILKFNKEFTHVLKGGTVIVKLCDAPECIWFKSEDLANPLWEYATDKIFAICIDDEYVEYRKALREGRIIECKSADSNWKEWNSHEEYFDSKLNYRIRPLYKVGDIVEEAINHKWSYIGRVKDVDLFSLTYSLEGNYTRSSAQEKKLRLWTPTEYKYYFFWNKGMTAPHYLQLIEIEECSQGKKFKAKDINGGHTFYDFVEPNFGPKPFAEINIL